MDSQGLVYLPDWLEGRLREDVVGVFGLVDEDRNHDRAARLARNVSSSHAVEHRNIDLFAQAGAVGEDAAHTLRQVA